MRANPLLMTVVGNPGRRYRENPFVLIDSRTLKIIRTWKGSMMDRKPWLWAQEAARRIGRDVFMVAHPHIPRGFKAGVEVSKMFFAGGPWQVVDADGGSRQGSWGDLSQSNPSIGASVIGGMAGALVTRALSNPGRRGTSEKKLDDIIARTWAALMSGVQVPMLDIPRIFRDIKLEIAAGTSIEQAVMLAGQKYRVNPLSQSETSEMIERSRFADRRAKGSQRMGDPRGEGYYRGRRDEAEYVVGGYGARMAVNPQNDGRCAMCGFSGPAYGPYIKVRSRRAGWVRGKDICRRCYSGMRQLTRKPHWKGNPGPKHLRMRGRKMTIPIERFAKLVRAQRDPALWKDFVAKCKGYYRWSHGTWPSKVTIEAVKKPGMSGIWIAYDMGREPEKTYIMPKGTKRKGAWKHPWSRMPQLKGDPEAGFILTKMVPGNRLTDFLHG